MKGKSFDGKKRIDLSDARGSKAMIAPREVAQDLYLETNHDAATIVKKSRALLNLCSVDCRDVLIICAISYYDEREREKNSQIVSSEKKDKQTGELSFYEWMVGTQGMSAATGRCYNSAINIIDRFVKKNNIGGGSFRKSSDYPAVLATIDALFQSSEFIELDQSQPYRFRAPLRKYREFLNEIGAVGINRSSDAVNEHLDVVDDAPYREILSEEFPKGFRIDSGLETKRFRDYWKKRHDIELSDDDETLRKRIATFTIRYNDFVYLPEMMVAEQTRERIFSYIDECFREGNAAVYFGALYKKFQPDFKDKRVNNPEMLEKYLSFVNNGRYYVHNKYLTHDSRAAANPTAEVRGYMKSVDASVTLDDLKKALPHIDADTVFRIVSGSGSEEFVRNRKGEYFHADIVNFTRQEYDDVAEMIRQSIDEKGYMVGKELTDAIEKHFPTVKERYPFLEPLGLRDVIAYKMRDCFSFNGKIISPYGRNLSMSDIFVRFAEAHEHFTLEQLNVLKQELDTPIYFDNVRKHSLRIDKENFVSRARVSFDTEATDNAISRFCTGDYVSLKDVSFFGSFPEAAFPWNGFLLESYVADFSNNFRLLHLGFNAVKPVGAIVKKESQIKDFDGLITAYLANCKATLESEEDALQYLVDAGLIARKKFKGLGQILLHAKRQRESKG